MKRWLLRTAIGLCVFVIGLLALLLVGYAYLSRAEGRLVSGGETRRYRLHVPEGYQPSVPAPLVISLHGAYLYPGMQQRLTGWNRLADSEGFLVAYPRARGFPRHWGLAPGPELEADRQFIADLIDKLSAEFSIDPTRIYVNGYSNGAAMTFMLSCTLAERIAAFGMVATPVVPWGWCSDQRPAPMIAFHGTADPYSLYHGGENFLTSEPLPDMESWFGLWGMRNRCSDEPAVSTPAEGVTLREFQGCAGKAAAAFYTIEGSGHVWPGGLKLPEIGTGPYSAAVDATASMWKFFQEHPLAAAPAVQ